MPTYEFRYLIATPGEPARESMVLAGDDAARIRAASELLRMPGRLGVEVWADERLVWRRLRGGPTAIVSF